MVTRSGLPWTCTGYYYSKLGGYGISRPKNQEAFDRNMMKFLPGSVNICVTNYDQRDIAKYLEHQGWTKTETDTKDLYVWSIKSSVFNEYRKKFNETQKNKVEEKKVEEEKQRRFGVKKIVPAASIRTTDVYFLVTRVAPFRFTDRLAILNLDQKNQLRKLIKEKYGVDVPHIWNKWDVYSLTNSIAQRRRYNG